MTVDDLGVGGGETFGMIRRAAVSSLARGDREQTAVMLAPEAALEAALGESARHHRHGVCPRQVLGARMGLYVGELLELRLPQTDKRLLTIVETDGCFVDGLAAATGCRLGSRTLRLEDHGKVAATFVDTMTGRAWRLVPATGIRERALAIAPGAPTRREAQLVAYRVIPASELFTVQRVELTTPLDALLSTPAALTRCGSCGEEIINGRERRRGDAIVCRACAGLSYYRTLGAD